MRRAGNQFTQTNTEMLPPRKTAPPAVVMRKADGSAAEPLPFTGISAESAAWAFLPHTPGIAPPAPVQARGDIGSVQLRQRSVGEVAAAGVRGGGAALPHAERIQAAFGPSHDVSHVQAHVGGAAAAASEAIGAQAYATGNHIAFRESPDLHTAAHEAAHVIQQRHGVSLKGGVGQVGDVYERHADAVADRVVAGQSAADLLSAGPTGSGQSAAVAGPSDGGAVQRRLGIGGHGEEVIAWLNGIAPGSFVVEAEPKKSTGVTTYWIKNVTVSGDLLPQVERFVQIFRQIVESETSVRATIEDPARGVVIANFRKGIIGLDDVKKFGVEEADFGENVASSGLAVLAHELYEQFKKAQQPSTLRYAKEKSPEAAQSYNEAHKSAIADAENVVSGWERTDGGTADGGKTWYTATYKRGAATQEVTHHFTETGEAGQRVTSVERRTIFAADGWAYNGAARGAPAGVIAYAGDVGKNGETIWIDDVEYTLHIEGGETWVTPA
ncbi:MAG: hypothetical protein Tsb0020_42720 [Haliangiales bacterium]